MDQPKTTQIFRTQSVDLATYLIFEGIKFTGCERSPINPNVVVLCFADEKQNCLDLERVFINSDFKKYRDINKWLLGKIHSALRDLPFSGG
jgi:hypothetical protein